MKKIALTVVSVFCVFQFSCKKSDDIALNDRAEALLGQWEYLSIMTNKAVDINGDGTVNIDLFNSQEIQQCLKDNLTFFTEMGTAGKGVYRINENGLACDNQEAFSTIEEDSYELINDASIQFEIRNEMRIIELTKTKLVIETNDVLGGENVIVTMAFTKK